MVQLGERHAVKPVRIAAAHACLAIAVRAQPDAQPLQAAVAEEGTCKREAHNVRYSISSGGIMRRY